jgi:hypothetical protein
MRGEHEDHVEHRQTQYGEQFRTRCVCGFTGRWTFYQITEHSAWLRHLGVKEGWSN